MNTLEGLRAGEYAGTKRIKIASGLTSFPLEILDLAPTLEILDLSGNHISSLPSTISRLQKLKIVFLSDCGFTIFPKELSQCSGLEMIAFKNNGMTTIPEDSFPPNLRWLILTNNKLEALPKSIGTCPRLQKCMLAGNSLKDLPTEMANCKKLGLLRLSANKLSSIPDWLLEMPELSFLAFAGNPCAPSFEDNPVLDDIAWSQLSVNTLLGEGASGIISKGVWKAEESHKEVAVKLFKGDITSDGLPADEMAACITAGSHPNLIDPVGKIHGHPDKRGLVLELIPPHYKNLGNPPTLDTCTRDSYPESLIFTVEKAVGILRSISSAAAHLHERGISHGDLYAHNILVDEAGHALLGDFGAASIYRRNHERAEALEKLEVLAFGHLIEDMMGLVPANNLQQDVEADSTLRKLHKLCTLSTVKDRPLFSEICQTLQTLKT